MAAGAIVLLFGLFFFGKTSQDKKPVATTTAPSQKFDFEDYLVHSKESLTEPQSRVLTQLESKLSSQVNDNQKIEIYNSIANFWKDSAHSLDFFAFYTSESSKLENSEKNLTFAAQLMLDALRNDQNALKRNWKAEQAVELFERAIKLNPNNTDLKIGLGSCYVFGKGLTGDAEQTMKGIQQLLQVVKEDSTNVKAQLVLGIGGVISTQYDKAIQRLLFVVNNQPNNLEAISWLADAYAGKGDKVNAVKWYEISKKMVNNPEYSKEVDARIKLLK